VTQELAIPPQRKLYGSLAVMPHQYSVKIPLVTEQVCEKLCETTTLWREPMVSQSTYQRTMSYCKKRTFSLKKNQAKRPKKNALYNIGASEGTCEMQMAVINSSGKPVPDNVKGYNIIKSIAFILTPKYTCTPVASLEAIPSVSWPTSYDACANACNSDSKKCNGFSWIGHANGHDKEDFNKIGRCALNTFVNDMALDSNALSCKRIIPPPSTTKSKWKFQRKPK
jgi:hypothetical protein